jgi:hypothetical protein
VAMMISHAPAVLASEAKTRVLEFMSGSRGP